VKRTVKSSGVKFSGEVHFTHPSYFSEHCDMGRLHPAQSEIRKELPSI
jgi:hypothetical protein